MTTSSRFTFSCNARAGNQAVWRAPETFDFGGFSNAGAQKPRRLTAVSVKGMPTPAAIPETGVPASPRYSCQASALAMV